MNTCCRPSEKRLFTKHSIYAIFCFITVIFSLTGCSPYTCTLYGTGGYKSYEGSCMGDEPHGYGISYYKNDMEKDGGTYEGEHKYGIFSGRGKRIYPNGNVYEGEYKEGHKHGKGVFTWTSGAIYDGEWKDGEMHGYGKYLSRDGEKKEGKFEHGKYIGP